MSTQRENVQINLKIQGIEDFRSLRDLNAQIIAQRNAVLRMDRTDPGLAEAATRLRDMVDLQTEWRDQIIQTRRAAQEQTQELTSGWSRIRDVAAGIFTADLFEGAIDWVKGAVQKVVTSFAEVQKSRAILTNAFKGDADLANKSLKMLLDFAAKTPYGLQEATDSFIKLVNRGIIPTQSEMRKLGDIAASQGKDLDQLVEAVLDAQTGENERLKEFGIKASKSGDLVSFTFKGVTKEVKNTEEAILAAILSFGEMDGVAGVMEAVSQTIVGFQSNIEDTWDQIFTKIGQKSEGFIYDFYNAYSSVLSWINEDLLATESLGQRLGKAFNDQALEVYNLEKNIEPLLNRYDELQKKGNLNKTEQTELKDVIAQVTQILPGAATGYNDLGEAMGIASDRARDLIASQRAMLQIQNKNVIDQLKKELVDYEKERSALHTRINNGDVLETGGFGPGSRTTTVRKMTDKEILETQNQLKDINAKIKLNQDAIKGYNGDYLTALLESKAKEQAKSTARTEGVIQKEIKALKELRAEQDVHSKAYAEYSAKIKKLEDELTNASGKKTAVQKKAESEGDKAAAKRKALDKEFEALELERVTDMLSSAQKEIDVVTQKFDKQIAKEQEFQLLKHASAKDLKASEEREIELKQQRDQAAGDIRAQQERKLNEKIKQLRIHLANAHASELEKEQEQINKFYDQEEITFAGNANAIANLKKERAADLADAELREAERLEEEKKKIVASGEGLLADNHQNRLLKINQQYDREIDALRKKFSVEQQLTQDFQDAIDAINANRRTAVDAEERAAERQKVEYGIQGAETLNNAISSMGANNRRRETDIRLKNLDEQRERELANKNLTEEQKKAINDRYDEKVRQEKLRAWKADQNAAAKQALISGLLGAAKALPNFILAGLAMAAGVANAAVIRNEKPPIYNKGGMIAQGPSHAEGGINLVNNATGEAIGEMEGGEPIMILSKQTAANNRALINELLFNSQYRNGARVSVNAELASQAIRPYNLGGVIPGYVPASGTSTPQAPSTLDTKDLEQKIEDKIDQLISVWEKGLDINYRYQTEYADKIAKLQNKVNAK